MFSPTISDMPITVLLRRCPEYGSRDLLDFLDACAKPLGLPERFSGHTVLLKPNLLSSRVPAAACTNARFLAAVAQWFIDRGARLCIGDSPAFGGAVEAMRRHGMLKLLTHLDVDIVEFKTPASRFLSNGVKIAIAEEALACDLFVNLPKIKAHNQMYMTMAVKNLFGIVVGMRKVMAHMKNGSSHLKFADLMLDLIGLTPPSVTFVDGIEVMHVSGPVGGERLTFGCLGASRNPLALDTALLAALDLAPQKCPINRAGSARGMAGSERGHLVFPFMAPEDFSGSGFVAPDGLNPVVFNPFRFLLSSLRRLRATG